MHIQEPAHDFKTTPRHRKLGYRLRSDARAGIVPNAMHRCLIEAGYAHAFGTPLDTERRMRRREVDQVAERVRALLGNSSLDTVD